jgi:UDPglucose--hexose-1-phosphate uridylyltransferase
VIAGDLFMAYAPFFSRYPYEVHITPNRHLQSLADFTRQEQRGLAETLKAVIEAYDLLFDLSFPYMMVLHQRPTDGGDYSHYHFHLELLPLMRAAGKLKYLAGSESGAGMFITDIPPEDAAVRLRSLLVPVRWKDGTNG